MKYICGVELVLKLPDGKPPFIGILMSGIMPMNGWYNWFDPSELKDLYWLEVQPSKYLILNLGKGVESYRFSLDYDPVELLKFIMRTKDATIFNFGILYRSQTRLEVNRHSSGHLMTLKVERIELSRIL